MKGPNIFNGQFLIHYPSVSLKQSIQINAVSEMEADHGLLDSPHRPCHHPPIAPATLVIALFLGFKQLQSIHFKRTLFADFDLYLFLARCIERNLVRVKLLLLNYTLQPKNNHVYPWIPFEHVTSPTT